MIRCGEVALAAFFGSSGSSVLQFPEPLNRITEELMNGFMDFVSGNLGWIEAICGPMFSGKSEELMRRLRRAMIARKRVQVFKPIIDNRYSDDEIVSHTDQRMKSEAINQRIGSAQPAGLADASGGNR